MSDTHPEPAPDLGLPGSYYQAEGEALLGRAYELRLHVRARSYYQAEGEALLGAYCGPDNSEWLGGGLRAVLGSLGLEATSEHVPTTKPKERLC